VNIETGKHLSIDVPAQPEDGPAFDRAKTVQKPWVLEALRLALSEKQIPQTVENIRSVEN